MKKYISINLDAIKKVVETLGDLNKDVIFVGGAVVGFYADDPAAEDVRPTKDVDITLELTSFLELTEFQDKLAEKGIIPAPDEKVICRFLCGDILLDVMSIEHIAWAPTNPWFKPGLKSLERIEIGKGIHIRVLSAAYFLASKFSAFIDRGRDSRTSHDFEDIVYILNNRLHFTEEILEALEDVRQYLSKQFITLLDDPEMEEGIIAHLGASGQGERIEILKEKLSKVIQGGKPIDL